MSATAALTETRARIAALWPLAADRSGNPNPPGEEDLPAFLVDLETDDSQPRAMGSGEYRQDATLTVEVLTRTLPSDDLQAALNQTAEQGVRAILAAPLRLGGAVWSINPGGREIRPVAGQARLASLTFSFAVVLHGPDPVAVAPAALGLS